jgi:pyruvate,water dikinase
MPDDMTGFPVEWEDPAYADIAWTFDPTHSPDATRPLDFDLSTKPFVGGFGWMEQDPILVNNYIYYPHAPMPAPPADAPPPPPGTNDRLREGGQRWREKILPEVQETTAFYHDTDFDAMSDADLADEVERLPEVRRRTGRQHTQVTTPAYIAMTLLTNTYKELVGGTELEALRLVQGYGSKSIDAGEAVWKLSELAETVPAVQDALLADEADESVLDELASLPVAAPFLAAFASYVDEYGWRSGGAFSEPTWAEDPATPLALVRAYMQTKGYDPAEEQRRLVEERDAVYQETMAQLDSEPRKRLEDIVDAARNVCRLMEDHNFWMDQRLTAMPRRLVLAAGRRLVSKNGLAKETDVFYLRSQELVDALRGDRSDTRDVALQSKAEFKRWSVITPPRGIGKPIPPGEQARILDESPEAPSRMQGNELQGNGSSAGVVRGPVRIVPTLEDSHRLRPGDVLVTVATLPPWTPLFAVASAVVTETGGILSHTAITAREYKLPAVLAVPGATRLLKDGQLVEVDGVAGTVRIVG